jgi:hypothetical protein
LLGSKRWNGVASIATFPGNVIAGLFHFETIPQLEIAPEERATPKVDFGTSGQKK